MPCRLQERARRLAAAGGGDQAPRPRQGLRLHHRGEWRGRLQFSRHQGQGAGAAAARSPRGQRLELREGGGQHQADPRAAAHRSVDAGPQLERNFASCSWRFCAHRRRTRRFPPITRSSPRSTPPAAGMGSATASTASTSVPKVSTFANGRRGISTAATSAVSTGEFTGKRLQAFSADSGDYAGAQYRAAPSPQRLSAGLSGL